MSAWIEFHESLRTNRKTLRFRRTLGVSRNEAIGMLAQLWWWCLDHAEDGALGDIHAEDLAELLEWSGEPDALLAALIDAGFIDQCDGGLYVHDWWDFAGRLVAKRQANRDRMRATRRVAKEQRVSYDASIEKERAMHVQNTCDERAGATEPNPTVHNRDSLIHAREETAPAPSPVQSIITDESLAVSKILKLTKQAAIEDVGELIAGFAHPLMKPRTVARDVAAKVNLSSQTENQNLSAFRGFMREEYRRCLEADKRNPATTTAAPGTQTVNVPPYEEPPDGGDTYRLLRQKLWPYCHSYLRGARCLHDDGRQLRIALPNPPASDRERTMVTDTFVDELRWRGVTVDVVWPEAAAS